MRRSYSKLGVAVWLVGLSCAAAADDRAADLIVYNGKLVTVDAQFATAEAAAIRDGKFIAVGTNAEISRTAGPKTQRVDLHSRTVVPGFTDTHNHQISFARSSVFALDLMGVRSIKEIQSRIEARVKQAKPGEPIRGRRDWWEYQLVEDRAPTRQEIDAVAPNNPVSLSGPIYVIVNSLALKLAGITRDTPDPQGGTIIKDGSGEPTGVLMGLGAIQLVSKLALSPYGFEKSVSQPSTEQIKTSLLSYISEHNSHGLVSIREQGATKEDEEIYRDLFQQGKLNIRIEMCFAMDASAPQPMMEKEMAALGEPGQQFGGGLFKADCISETPLDGGPGVAHLREDFPDRPGFRGIQNVPTERFKQFALAAAKSGWRLAPHAVGDAAIDQALDAFEFVNTQVPISDRRWTIDHAFLLHPDQYERVKKLGLVISSQYMHNYQLGKELIHYWKRPLADQSEAYADWLKHGIMLAAGSDGPGAYPTEPLLWIYGEVTRKTAWGGSLGADQGLTREQAIRSATINPAYVAFAERTRGSIEPGKYADFVLLSQDILTVPAAAIKDIKVLATVLGGRVVYGSLEPATPMSVKIH